MISLDFGGAVACGCLIGFHFTSRWRQHRFLRAQSRLLLVPPNSHLLLTWSSLNSFSVIELGFSKSLPFFPSSCGSVNPFKNNHPSMYVAFPFNYSIPISIFSFKNDVFMSFEFWVLIGFLGCVLLVSTGRLVMSGKPYSKCWLAFGVSFQTTFFLEFDNRWFLN